MKKKGNIPTLEVLANLPLRVDYLLLADCFSGSKSPKKKIFDLKKKGYLQQLKRGQYFNLKSKYIQSTAYETIANSIYFPSYVSMEWALQFYGLISDRVTCVTSVTLLRSAVFRTAYAPFSYTHLNKNRYPVGYVTKLSPGGDHFLIARPEKALMDYVNLKAKNLNVKSGAEIQEFLENDLRLDINEFLRETLTEDLRELQPFYHRNSKEHQILRWLIYQKSGES